MLFKVIALIVLAACVGAGDTGNVTFVHHELPSSYSLRYSGVNSSQLPCGEGFVWVRDNFVKWVREFDFKDVTLVRPDIKTSVPESSSIAEFLVSGSDHECYLEWEPDTFTPKDILPSDLYSVSFDTVEETEFDGVRCRKYNNSDEELYATMDNYLIAVAADGFLYRFTFNFDPVPLTTFVIEKSESEDCNESAYRAPENTTFVHHELPCSFSVNYTAYTSSQSLYGLGSVLVRDKFMKRKEVYGNVTSISLVRPDIRNSEPSSIAVFRVEGSEQCAKEWEPEGEVVTEVLPREFFAVKYSSVETTEYKGVQCKKYTSTESELYATMDNYLIAVHYLSVDIFIEFSYHFETVPMATFVMDKSESANCGDSAYSAPTTEACTSPSPTPSGSSHPPTPSGGSSSSMVKAVFSLVIASIALSLLSLF